MVVSKIARRYKKQNIICFFFFFWKMRNIIIVNFRTALIVRNVNIFFTSSIELKKVLKKTKLNYIYEKNFICSFNIFNLIHLIEVLIQF